MFARHMHADEWYDRADHGTSILNPTWDQVEEAIRALDGKRKTLVSLSDKAGGNRLMIIAGQRDGRVVVNATPDNVEFFSLVDPSRSSDRITLYVGGQDGEYEERKCVPLAWALEVAKTFCETGELKPSMNWESDY